MEGILRSQNATEMFRVSCSIAVSGKCGKQIFAMSTSVTWRRNLLEAFGKLDAIRRRRLII